MLRDEYRIKQMTKVTRQHARGSRHQAGRRRPEALPGTLKAYNEAVQTDVPFNPAIKDGRGTVGLTVPKTNWANMLDTPPYEAYAITCGVTFTFGGVKIDPANGQVEDVAGKPMPGLFAAGELVGGLFYHNYAGGSGLVSGSVFGKLAGTGAAACVK